MSSPPLHSLPDETPPSQLTDDSGIRVLYVDDDADFADLVAVYLERESDDIEVVTEHDADAGLERLDAGGIDCVVSDYDMPGTDGLEFLAAVRERSPDIPFLLFTGKGSEDVASEAISAGVTDYLQKESGTEQYAALASRIENATRRSRVRQEVERGFSAVETARVGISFLDESGQFLYVNPAYADTYGYAREEMVGEHWEVLSPERVYEEVLPAVPEDGQWSGESIHVRRDGERIVVDHALAYTEEGILVCFIRDLTGQKETERALEVERQRFELFVESVGEYAIASLDENGFVTSWNEGARRITGYETDEILGEHVSAFYPEEKAEAGYPDDLLETAIEEGSAEDTGWRLREDGSQFWASVVISAVFDEDDRHRGFLAVTRDLTDRLTAGRTLEDDVELLEQALNILDDAFYILDERGEFIHVTDRAAEITGYSKDELYSMSPAELFVPEDRPLVMDRIEQALSDGESRKEATILRKDGETIPFEFRSRRLTDEDGEFLGIAGIGRDIREQKRHERRLERQLAQFEQFGSVLSHDLRTPLQTAYGRLELARDTGDEEHFSAVEQSLERLEELIDDLSETMREAQLVSDPTSVDLSTAARSVWDSLDTTRASIDVDAPRPIRADENALKRLLENLLKNALDHCGDDVAVSVGLLPDGFYVEDDGPGIDEEERDRVFEINYSTKPDGGGVGLASVKQLAVAHGWDISVAEGDDGGARFEITDVAFAE